MKANSFLTILFVIFTLKISAQTKATTEDGRKIIVFEDGTWTEQLTEMHCDKLIKKITTTKTSGLMSVNPIKLFDGNNTMEIDLIKNEEITVFNMRVNGNNICFGQKDIVTFNIIDGSEIKLNYTSSVANCKGEFSIFFGETFKNLEPLNDLINSKLKSIAIKSYKFNISEYDSDLLKNTLKCLN